MIRMDMEKGLQMLTQNPMQRLDMVIMDMDMGTMVDMVMVMDIMVIMVDTTLTKFTYITLPANNWILVKLLFNSIGNLSYFYCLVKFFKISIN